MAASRFERILILCKTYPSPSSKYAETSCVAGMTEAGELIRLFPVPFRLIEDGQKFKKWQWIKARIQKASREHRRESHTIFVDTISTDGKPISSKEDWRYRRNELNKLPVFNDFEAMERARQETGGTIALLRPERILKLDIIKEENPEWTAGELEKLVSHQRQAGLFDQDEARDVRTLRKLPYKFYYQYQCVVDGIEHIYKHKLADWEVGALYWNCKSDYGDKWEVAFRERLEKQFPLKDIHFLMGTIHRFPDQWLIISLIYPPKADANVGRQVEMEF